MKHLRYVPKSVGIGSVLYSVYVEYDPELNPKNTISLDEHVVTTIRKNTMYLVRKTDTTWVAVGKGKNKKFGWSKSIPDYYRSKIVDGILPVNIFSTIHGAFTNAIESCNEMIKKFRNHIEEGIEKKTLNNADLEYYQDLIDGYTKLIPMIKGRMTKAKKK